MAAREKRGTTTASAATRPPASVAAASTSRPASPPIQIDAAARCSPVEREHEPDRARRRGVAGEAREARARRRRSRPRRRSRAAPRRVRRVRPGRSSASAAPAATASRREHGPEVAERAPEARVAYERHDLRRDRSRVSARTRPSPARGRRAPPRARRRARCRRRVVTPRRARSLPPVDLQRPRDHGCGTRAGRSRASIAEQQHPARPDEARRRRALAERRDHELRRRAGARPDRERERAAHRVPVGRDHAPPDEVPALRQLVHRDEDRVLVVGRARRAARDLPGCRCASVTEITAKRGSMRSL